MRHRLDGSVGMVKTRGWWGALEAAEAMIRLATARVAGSEESGDGFVTVTVYGTVGAVREAVEIGSAAAERVGELVSVFVIPRPLEGEMVAKKAQIGRRVVWS